MGNFLEGIIGKTESIIGSGLKGASVPLQNYFTYMLLHATINSIKTIISFNDG